jgi:hypothetical protein
MKNASQQSFKMNPKAIVKDTCGCRQRSSPLSLLSLWNGPVKFCEEDVNKRKGRRRAKTSEGAADFFFQSLHLNR